MAGSLVGLFAAVLCLGASPALAERSLDSSIPGFNGPRSVSLDAGGDVWISDGGHSADIPGEPGKQNPGQNGIYEYSGYPSQTLLSLPNTFPVWSFYILTLDLSVDQGNEEVFVAQSNGRTVDIFEGDGTYSHSWSGINGAAGGAAASAGIHVAVDNSNTASRGRVYLSLTSPENDVEALDAGQRPVQFPALAPYVKENRLTGTPSGAFGEVQQITVDTAGNIYVTDAAKKQVDEFESTGLFLRSFPAPRAGSNGAGGVGVDPTDGNVLITESSFNSETGEGGLAEFDSSGNFLARNKESNPLGFQPEGTPAVDSNGRAYVPAGSRIDIFNPAPVVPTVTYGAVSAPTATSGVLNASVDPNGAGPVTACHFQYGTSISYGSELPCEPGAPISSASAVTADVGGLGTGTTYHYRLVVGNGNGPKYGADQTYTPQTVVGLRTDLATGVTEAGATINASLVGDGTPTHYLFEWGRTTAYGNSSATAPGADLGSPSGPTQTAFSYQLSALEPFATYHYRVVATAGGGTSYGEDRTFTTLPGVPEIGAESVSSVHSDRAVLHGQVNPQGADASYHFEYVTDSEFEASGFEHATKAPLPEQGVGMGKGLQAVSLTVDGLEPGTVYHYRVVATNIAGTGLPTVDKTFTTFPFGFSDTCPNAHVRQQTGAALLLDCRAYELASAANAGGYDVESNLVPGQSPFGGYPLAVEPSQLLYGTHDGGVPGTGSPTNRGVDPYVATRGQDGWTTRYVGIPSDNPYATGPFASTLLEASAGLGTFAFGGPDVCSPCFADGTSGEPIHLPDGSLVQGMAGSLDPGPGAEPAGYIGKRMSLDGRHFVFGSTARFEPDGNSNGDVSIYDRDVTAGVTHVVSKTPGGQTMTGSGIAELDISADGSRIVIGKLVSTDSGGSRYWHLYMDIGDADSSIDLTPGTTSGVLYDGMTGDGTKVFFTSRDALTGDDTDSSADIYRADVTTSSATLTRVSAGTGGAGNTDACEPAGNTVNIRWNTNDGTTNCDAVAVGGGGGVSTGSGAIYFLSPEALDTSGAQGQPVLGAPNLYVSTPGSAPRFIRTLESSANAPLPPASHPFVRSFGSFANPAGVAIDHSNGDSYVFDIGTESGTGYVQKYDASGHPVLGFGSNGKLAISGVIGFYNIPTGLAVDNDPSSPNYRDVFVPDLSDGIVKIFDPTGAHVADIEGLEFPDAVSINPQNGNIYVAEYFGGVSIFSPALSLITSFGTITAPTGVAVDSSGNAYVVNGGGLFAASGTPEKYDSSGADLGQLSSGPANGVAVDPSDDHVYVDEVERAVEFDPAGQEVGAPIGAGLISSSIGLAVDDGTVDITNRGTTNIASFAPAITPSDPETDNPLVIDSVSFPSTRYTGDFETNPSGTAAVFTSTLPLTGYEIAGHREVYRYDDASDSVQCASCNPTGEPASGEANLPAGGLGLSDDGRVFFDSTEGLVDRDLNNKKDAYEWESGKGIELISTGTGPLASSLLGISADGTDAYFFTHDILVPEDDNGNRVKIYDARSGGGFPVVPDEIPCKASDECHGPGSQASPPPDIGTIAGTAIGNKRASSGRGHKHHRHRKGGRKNRHGKQGKKRGARQHG